MSARRAATLVACFALLAACSQGGNKISPAAEPSITVGATSVPSTGVGTVADALHAAGVVVPSGRILAIKSRRSLGPDTRPGQVLVDGVPTLPFEPIAPGAVITVERGADVTEPIETANVPVPANKGEASLHVGAHPGSIRVTRGRLSHEILTRSTLTPSSDGHLIAPRAIALTFDDGPTPKYTPRILALLAAAHVHATFCLIGRQAQQYPDLVKAIVAGGHTLCNHTWDHDEKINKRSPAQIIAEMTKAQKAITKASGGIAPTFFRAPGGAFSPEVDQIARSLHLTPLKWTVDPRDWSRPGVPHIEGVVLASTRPGSIVLLHDGGGNRDQTVAATQFLLAHLAAAKFSFWFPQNA